MPPRNSAQGFRGALGSAAAIAAAARTERVGNFLQDAVLRHAAVELGISRAVIDAHGHVDIARAVANRLDVARVVLAAPAAAVAAAVSTAAAALAAAAALPLVQGADTLPLAHALARLAARTAAARTPAASPSSHHMLTIISI